MSTFARALAATMFAAVTLLAALPAPQASAATLDATEADLVAVVNEFRASRGLTTLVVSDTLTFSAKWMATDMAVYDYFSHTSRDGRGPSARMADAGYPAAQTYTGENLAAGYASAREVLNGWIASPAHLAVLTNPTYRAIGVGRSYGGASTYRWYWTMNVGGLVDRPTTASLSDLGYHAVWHAQSPYLTLAPGQTGTLVLALKNTGYRGWYRGIPGQQVSLGTADPLDVARPELAHGWLSANRIATSTTAYVGPGQVGWFEFQVKAPAYPGVYRLRVRAVVDGTIWLEDPGIYWTVTVR